MTQGLTAAHVAAGSPSQLTRRGVSSPLLSGLTLSGPKNLVRTWSENGLLRKNMPLCRDYAVRMRGLEPHLGLRTAPDSLRHIRSGPDMKSLLRRGFSLNQAVMPGQGTSSADRAGQPVFGPDLVRDRSET